MTDKPARARVYRNAFGAWQWAVRDGDGRPVMFGAEQSWPEAMQEATAALRLAPGWWRL